ncbi:MAG: ABC transporter ATP-binding protein [Halobacteriales archaeon]|nr:ABC transporter ATP-binding protein [Halobacteriales archaeon]
MQVTIEGITKRYGDITAVDEISLTAEEGELTSLVGPSGCGKTTTLRLISGLISPNEGRILIGDEVVAAPQEGIHVPIQKRDVGFVFQTFDVWPHLDVFDNVAFPLKIRDFSKREIEERVHDILDLANIEALVDKSATDLSGGQQARVSICRALVYEPKILLFDEPLTGLDRNLRRQMRYEIRRIQREVGITSVYVTHNQPEAMTMSDKICLLNTRGQVEQIGTAQDIYRHPTSRYSFDFFGTSQYLDGEVGPNGEIRTPIGAVTHTQEPPEGGHVTVAFRPEELELSRESHADWSANTWSGVVEQYSFLGDTHEFSVRVDGETLVARQSRLEEGIEEGDRVHVHIDADFVHLFDEV